MHILYRPEKYVSQTITNMIKIRYVIVFHSWLNGYLVGFGIFKQSRNWSHDLLLLHDLRDIFVLLLKVHDLVSQCILNLALCGFNQAGLIRLNLQPAVRTLWLFIIIMSSLPVIIRIFLPNMCHRNVKELFIPPNLAIHLLVVQFINLQVLISPHQQRLCCCFYILL